MNWNNYIFYIFKGCTANIALIDKNKLYVANCGDSRSIVYNSNNNEVI